MKILGAVFLYMGMTFMVAFIEYISDISLGYEVKIWTSLLHGLIVASISTMFVAGIVLMCIR